MSATLTVWKFDEPEAAERVQDKLLALQKQELVTVHDAAVVTWPADKKKPKTKQLNNLTGAGAAGGAFWGLLFGVLFAIPWFGAAIGAMSGALAGALTDVGIDDDFIESVRSQVTEGTSALFVMTSDAVTDRVKEGLAGESMELITTNMSMEDEAAVRDLFADD